jgi:metal-sulfur cluster biosynthetic enzyme
MLTQEQIYQHLKTVIDPELHINIVDLGLIYGVVITEVESAPFIKITMTLTTPGCPMAGTIRQMIKDSLFPIKELNVDRNVDVEVTFDPPWSIECMTEEAKAELGF